MQFVRGHSPQAWTNLNVALKLVNVSKDLSFAYDTWKASCTTHNCT